ncbi:MAG: dihydrolipoamide acetyltransferase family protein [Christensenellales bacterium]|jgi:pyruvate dehydrogenase E2 component (dihydrolipoamide acetyltransferase)
MAYEVIMPKQGLQMTEGTIMRWLVREGEHVEEGAPLFEMETDKLTITIDAPRSGTLIKILRGEGETVPITQAIALIGEEGEAAEHAEPKPANEQAPAQRIVATPAARTLAARSNIDLATIRGSGPAGRIILRDVEAARSAPKITPLAAAVARARGVDVSGIAGTGPGGKILKDDVLSAMEPAAPPAAGPSAPQDTLVPFTGIRRIIADNMTASLHEMAQACLRMKVDMTALMALREEFKAREIRLSVNDVFVRVVSRALREHPAINASLTPEGIIQKRTVHIGIAVALEQGLIVPVIRNADTLTLPEIAAQSSDLIARARRGGLSPDEYRGGTFTITNLGMFDVDDFVAIINPPECAILALGKIERTPVVRDDAISIRPVMTMTLTYDHRIVDGAPAARFLQRIKELAQNPGLLL